MLTAYTASFLGARFIALGLTLVVGGRWCVHHMAKAWDYGPGSKDADATDPPLLWDHSEIKEFRAERTKVTYSGIRVFYRRHPKADELPKEPTPIPLLVFIHGLGGSVAQFHPLLTSLTNCASCLAVDLPGCGRSRFAPTSWDAYTPDALTDLVETVIDEYQEKNQGVVLVAHSMGTVIAARLANKSFTHRLWPPSHVMGLVAICPVSGPPPEPYIRKARWGLCAPDFVFNLFRAWDRWGGPESASVKRFTGPGADLEARQLQNTFNSQSRTPVFRRMAWGALPTYFDGKPQGGLFGKATWSDLNIPVYLIGGQHDTVTPPKEVEATKNLLQQPATDETINSATPANYDGASDRSAKESNIKNGATLGEAAAPINTTTDPRAHFPQSIQDISHTDFERKQQRAVHVEEFYEDPTTPRDNTEAVGGTPNQLVNPPKIIKSDILPAGHALLYMPTTVRTLAGLVGDFLNDHVTGRLSLGWQLQYLSKEGKWDVKNLAKWESVNPVSEPIGGIFRAMKTLREVDEEHSPKKFTKKWGHIIKDVIDISHAEPVYDPRNFGASIKYHKFPTVSKIPPTDAEVLKFVKLVDNIREDQRERAASEPDWDPDTVIGVHCHYGFNRTGYFVVCYLVERCNYNVHDAIDAFAKGRANGIRHSHFLDRLYLRYSGLKD
ncbi:Alpha/Beta hydrolase protein [Xylariaceae sp. FL0016]|nr:Alpha/Beta hydrolase protein [Xylariaceae sp. FL0016]